MHINQIEVDAIDNVYKNAHIALQSISDVLPLTSDAEFERELKDEYERYETKVGEISTFMKERSLEPKDINVFKKAGMWMGIKMNALTDRSTSHLADMMIKGTVMGITELGQLLGRENGSLSEETKFLIKDLISLEEDCESRLKKFL